MKWTKKSWAILAGALALIVDVRGSIENATSNDRSYQVIVDRNPFNLKPLPPPAQNLGPTNPPAKTNLKLTGFTTLGIKRAFFVLIDEKTKTNQPISLAIDQEVDGLKVLEIDPRVTEASFGYAMALVRLRREGKTRTRWCPLARSPAWA
jgi:hypothetical protein